MILVLATGGSSRSLAAQSGAVEGPRRGAAFASIVLPFERERADADVRVLARPRATGAVLGGIVGGAVGFAGGYTIDNIEENSPRVGSATLVATAGGLAAGALLGGAVGWLVERYVEPI